MTPEAKVKVRVKAMLNEHAAYYFMPVQTGLGSRTLDFLGCHSGRFFSIETKAPGKHMTEQQLSIADRMMKSGARVFEISGDLGELEAWLRAEMQVCVFS
jgi:hypothetical protein